MSNAPDTVARRPVRLLIVDDSNIVRRRIERSQQFDDLQVVGTAAIEYGLIAALVSVAIVTTLTAVGGDLKTVFSYIGTQLTSATTPSTSS